MNRHRVTAARPLVRRTLGGCFLVTALILVQLQPGVPPARAAAEADALSFFDARVRPVLEANCFKCHGKDPAKLKGELQLNNRDGILRGGELGPAVDLENPDRSLLLKMISYADDEHQMPPKGKLAPGDLEILTRWVTAGVPWKEGYGAALIERKGDGSPQVNETTRNHWAYRPLVRPTAPQVADASRVKNPIDAFVLARVEAAGLTPAPPASRLALVRRAYYDLLGLPPTPAEVAAFLQDTKPGAWERLIDKLLESPHYGEKWGRHWLDLVRWAETNSFERDNPKPHAWRYRDYVIRSLNEDKPYDQFMREQLAGDEATNPTAEQMIATGFYRLGLWDDEPVDRKQAYYDYIDDIVRTTGEVFLGMTVGCARCHDHKIDPMPQADYYRLVAFFDNIQPHQTKGGNIEGDVFLGAGGASDLERARKQHQAKMDAIQGQITGIDQVFRKKYEAEHKDKSALTDMDDLRYRFYRDSWLKLPDFDNIKHESEGVLPAQRFDTSPATRENFYGFVFQGVLKVPRNGRYTFFLDSDDGSRLTVDGKAILTHDGIHGLGSAKKAVIELKQGRRAIRLDYFQGSGGRGLDIAWSGPGVPRRSLSAGVNAKAPAEALTKLIGRHGRELLGDDVHRQYNRLTKELGALKKNPPQAAKALVIKEKGPKFGKAFVYIRGSVHAPGDEVTPGFPEVLGYADPQFPAPRAGVRSTGRRSVLANWLGSPENKLTPRVMANRLWQHHFGRGIARSPNDFGFGGVAPTHPDLLDWLAVELVEGGWRLKRMHKLMMTSGTYLMSSAGQAAAEAKDPTNDLFWRFNMRRLGAEEIRDSILAVNGTLNLDLYGPSIYPQIPREVMHGQSRPGSGWRRSTPEQQARRSIYVHVKRSLLLPILESFDLADVDNSCPVRFATTQPTQALGLLNSGFINQQAKFLAARLKEQAGTSLQDQVTLALSLVLQRPPKRQEVAWGLDLIRDLTEKDGASADVALNQFCLTALNLNEFVYLD